MKIKLLRPSVGIGVMIKKGNKILLGRRKNAHGASSYGWCGGHLEYNETFEECAKREVLEESGLIIISMKFLCLSNIIFKEDKKHYVDIEFLTEDFKGEPKVLEKNKLESWNWYDLKDLPSPLFEPVEVTLKSFKTGNYLNS